MSIETGISRQDGPGAGGVSFLFWAGQVTPSPGKVLDLSGVLVVFAWYRILLYNDE